jgi:hypothetical protein
MGYDLKTTLTILSIILVIPVFLVLFGFMVMRVVKANHE